MYDLLLQPGMSVKSQEVTHIGSKVSFEGFKRYTLMKEKILNKKNKSKYQNITLNNSKNKTTVKLIFLKRQTFLKKSIHFLH